MMFRSTLTENRNGTTVMTSSLYFKGLQYVSAISFPPFLDCRLPLHIDYHYHVTTTFCTIIIHYILFHPFIFLYLFLFRFFCVQYVPLFVFHSCSTKRSSPRLPILLPLLLLIPPLPIPLQCMYGHCAPPDHNVCNVEPSYPSEEKHQHRCLG